MAKTTARIPRPEYPRPQFVRERWLNLNGPWEFEIDAGDSGLERGLLARKAWSFPYQGQPYFISEFGGIWWNPNVKKGEFSWGYGDRPKTIEEFYRRFAGMCRLLLDDPNMFGYCYTQLTDVYQEQNGIDTFDRNRKFDMSRIRRAQQRRAAI